MSPKKPYTLKLDVDLLTAMQDIKDRDGVPVTVQIEKAVRQWLKKEHGILVEPARRRVSARRRT